MLSKGGQSGILELGCQEGVRTAVKGLELVARQLGSGHALQERTDAGIVLAPEVVGDCTQSVSVVFRGLRLRGISRMAS